MTCEEFRAVVEGASPLDTPLDERLVVSGHYQECPDCQKFVDNQAKELAWTRDNSPEIDKIALLDAATMHVRMGHKVNCKVFSDVFSRLKPTDVPEDLLSAMNDHFLECPDCNRSVKETAQASVEQVQTALGRRKLPSGFSPN